MVLFCVIAQPQSLVEADWNILGCVSGIEVQEPCCHLLLMSEQSRFQNGSSMGETDGERIIN